MSNPISIKNINPAPGYVFVEPAKQEKKTSSGLYLPDSHSEKPQYGTVLAVGEKLVNDRGVEVSAPVKVGETVIYKKWGGNEYQVGDTEYQFLRFDDILAVINDNKSALESARDSFNKIKKG